MELKGLEGLSLAGSSVTEDGLKHLKYRHLCKYGMTDHSPNYKELKV